MKGKKSFEERSEEFDSMFRKMFFFIAGMISLIMLVIIVGIAGLGWAGYKTFTIGEKYVDKQISSEGVPGEEQESQPVPKESSDGVREAGKQ